MIRLTDYVIQTEGKLPPEDIFNCCGIKILYSGQVWTLAHCLFLAEHFEDVDGNFENYKYRLYAVSLSNKNKKFVRAKSRECYVLDYKDELIKELYE